MRSENQLQHTRYDQQTNQKNDPDYPKQYFHCRSRWCGAEIRQTPTGLNMLSSMCGFDEPGIFRTMSYQTDILRQ